jgi:hypothetical protein
MWALKVKEVFKLLVPEVGTHRPNLIVVGSAFKLFKFSPFNLSLLHANHTLKGVHGNQILAIIGSP